MLPELSPLLAGRAALIVAASGACAGAVLWLAGARFSRSLVTLVAVAIGAKVGLRLPGWFGWSIDGIGLAFGGAVVLGLSGYLLHSSWVGAVLALLMGAWACIAAWFIFSDGSAFPWSALGTIDSREKLVSAWQAVPPNGAQVLPWAFVFGSLAGVLTMILRPRFAKVLTYSMLGASLLTGLGLSALAAGAPRWLSMVPSRRPTQLMLMFALVVVGAYVQWRLSPRASALAGEATPAGCCPEPRAPAARDGAD